jgi:hypothetical protein
LTDNSDAFESSDPGDALVDAAKAMCMAKVKHAEATIGVYLSSPQGVADHSGIVEEIIKLAREGAEAKDAYNFLDELW